MPARTVGALFVRSFERGERVYLAMCSRGYTGAMPAPAGIAATGRQWTVREDVAFGPTNLGLRGADLDRRWNP